MTLVSVRFLPIGQIGLAFDEVELHLGFGVHRLVLPASVMCTWLDPEDPQSFANVLINGTAWCSQPRHRWLAELEPASWSLRGFKVGEHLALSLTDDQLVVLERERGLDDMVLQLDLRVTLLSPATHVHPVSTEQATIRISRGRWADLLDQAETEVGIVLRIPSPLEPPGQTAPEMREADRASLAQAASRLRQARAELRDHQWEHCVATCRRVLENLARLSAPPSAKALSSVPLSQRTLDERWASIFHDLKSLTSAAHHDDAVTSALTWRRGDAEAALAATAGLLQRYLDPD